MIKICFPQPVKNAYRYQGFIHAILDRYSHYSLRYNDYSIDFIDKGFCSKLLFKIHRVAEMFIQIISILTSDVIIFCNMGIDYRLFRIANFLGKKTIVDFYISRYQTSVLSRNSIPLNSKKANKLLKNEKYILRNSSTVVFLDNTEKDFYTKILDVNLRKSKIIPLISNTYNKKAKLKYWHEKRKICFCWWGGEFNPIHGLPCIIKALKRMENEGLEFFFYIFGVNKKYGDVYYTEMLKEVGWEDKVIPRYDLTFQNEGLIDFLVNNCSIAFGPLSIEPKATNVITNKALDAISLGLPLITINSPAMKEYFRDDSVWYSDNNKEESIIEVIQKIINSSLAEVEAKVSVACEIHENNFTLQSQKKKIYELLDETF